MSKKLSLLLTTSAVFFMVVTVFVALPAIIYDSNPGEFSVPFLNIVARLALPALALIALAVLPALLLPPKLARFWSAAIATTAIYIWIRGVFQTHNFGDLDGQKWPADVPTWQIVSDILAIAVGSTLAFILSFRFQKITAIFVLSLGVGLLAQSWPLVSNSQWIVASDEKLMPEVAEFSDKENALVVLLDTMASDVFEQVVKNNPDISRALDGFIFYPDTVGVSPSTYLAMPTIHSGKIYKNGNPAGEFFKEMVQNHSVLSKVAKAGYHSTLVNPVQNICPNGVECITAEAAMRGMKALVYSESIRILDVLLFRIAPLGLKNSFYNQGEWVLQKWANGERHEDKRFIQMAFMHNHFLQEMAASVSVSSSAPTLKFIHLLNTHPPYVYTEACGYEGQRDWTRVNFAIQVKCSLDSLRQLLQSLKANNIYDKTAIILLADHGNQQLESTRTSLAGNFGRIVGAANPTFAIKPVNSKGAFKSAGGEISLGDFGATLCELISVCSADSGISALKEPSGRVRVFNNYKWKREFWMANSIGGLEVYETNGPVGKINNWVKAPLVVGQQIDFSDKGASGQYTMSGWAGPEPSGTWSDGAIASLVMNPSTSAPVQLTVHASAFLHAESLRATVLINDKPAGEMAFNAKKPTGEFSFVVSEDALEEGLLKVDFLIDEPRSPKELHLSEDARKLGIRVHSMRLDHLQP